MTPHQISYFLSNLAPHLQNPPVTTELLHINTPSCTLRPSYIQLTGLPVWPLWGSEHPSSGSLSPWTLKPLSSSRFLNHKLKQLFSNRYNQCYLHLSSPLFNVMLCMMFCCYFICCFILLFLLDFIVQCSWVPRNVPSNKIYYYYYYY